MISAFDVFNNAHIEVYAVKKAANNGYISKDEVKETRETLAELDADIQPYSGGLAEKEYGLTVNCEKRMYCAPCVYIREGNFIKDGEEHYKILYAESWELGAVAVLGKVKA